jgi:hypothetical protein
MSFLCRCFPHGFALWFGFLQIAMGLLLAVRRLAFVRYLVLERDELIVPTGLLQVRTIRVPYLSIQRVWQSSFPLMAVLEIATKGGKFEVVSGMLPDAASYLAVGDFLYARAQDNQSGGLGSS